MTRSLARHLGLRLLPLVMSWVILAPRVLQAYNITRNNNVRPFYHKASRFAETTALIPFFRSIVLPARCVRLRRLITPRLASVLIPTTASYWSQNNASGNGQQNISTYCQDDTIDNIIVAFLNDFGITDGEPRLSLVSLSCLPSCYLPHD